MNPYAAYKQRSLMGWTRIDMLLALYDAAIEKLEKAVEALKKKDKAAAAPLLVRAQVLVGGLVAGLSGGDDEVSVNLARLYEFVLFSLKNGQRKNLEAALKVLCNLRAGFQGIRDEAVQLERSGVIPSVGATEGLALMA